MVKRLLYAMKSDRVLIMDYDSESDARNRYGST